MPPTKRVPTRKANSPLFSKPIPTLKPVPAPVTTTTTRSRRNPLQGRQRSTISTPIITPPTVPLFKDGPVLKEVGSPTVPTVTTPNIFLPQSTTIKTTETAIINPLLHPNSSTINQPNILANSSDIIPTTNDNLNDYTPILILAGIVCGIIILKKI
jgi:hypothetical protein